MSENKRVGFNKSSGGGAAKREPFASKSTNKLATTPSVLKTHAEKARDAADERQRAMDAIRRAKEAERVRLEKQQAAASALEPTFADNCGFFFEDLANALQSWWRRVMAVPIAFTLWHYVIPFTLEMSILGIHFDELHSMPVDVPYVDWVHFPRMRNFVLADAIIGTLLAVRLLLQMAWSKVNIIRFLFSAYGLVSILTVPMMMLPAFQHGAAAFQSVLSGTTHDVLRERGGQLSASTLAAFESGELLFSTPSVAAWRIWIVYDIVQTIIFASSTVSKSFRAIVFQLSFILALFFTCMATMQLIFCVERGTFLDLGTSFYFTAVTLTTVGYGDFAPTSVIGRAFIITQIFAAMLAVPLLLAETERLMKFLLSLTGYAGSDRHIIIFGELTETEFEQMIAERTQGDGRDDPLHMVFVATHFSAAVQERVAGSAVSSYITLCVAHQLSRADLLRFTPQRADAALFFSSSTASAMRGDYRTIAAAASVRLHHPSLPQYLIMRRTEAAHLVEGAFVVFDRDFLRSALLGTSLQIPGFLPMFLNLIRLVPEKIDMYHAADDDDDDDGGGGGDGAHADTSNKHGEDGKENSPHQHNAKHGRSSVPSPRGGGAGGPPPSPPRDPHQHQHQQQQPPPPESSSWYEMYLAGAKQNIYSINVPDVLVGRTFVVASFIVQLRTGAIPIGLVRDSRVALNAGTTPVTANDMFVVVAKSWEDLYSRFSNFPTTSAASDATAVTKIALRSKEIQFEMEHHANATALWLAASHNCFPFQNHVVLIDLASFVSQQNLCSEENFQREKFRVQDMLALASRFPRWQSFVLLSLTNISEILQQEWAASGRQPMFHVRRSPLDPDALKLCRLGTAMSVLIFSSLQQGTATDTFRSAMLTVNRRVVNTLHAELAGRPPGTSHPNVITVIGAPEEAMLLSPEHVSHKKESLDHDAHCTAFATGGALCPTLLDGLMFRTYYNEYLPQVVELLLEPGALHREKAEQLCPTLFQDAADTAASKSNFGSAGAGGLADLNATLSNADFGSASASGLSVKLPTYGQLCRVMTAGKMICFGISRVIKTAERGPETVGKTFFVTNPEVSTPIDADDYIFYLAQWSQERLARDFFA